MIYSAKITIERITSY